MIDMSGSVLSTLRDSTRQCDRKMVDALDSRLADSERVVSRLSTAGTLVHESGDETTERGGGDGGVLFVATDRKLVFVLDTPTGRQTADIPYTDVKDATVDSGFLSTTVSVTVWGRGQFRLSPSKTDDVNEIVSYITTASELWQRVVAALQDARQHMTVLDSAITEGRTADAEAAHESVLDCLETARTRANDAPVVLEDAIADRIETVDTERQRTRMESHIERGRTLAEQTTPVKETGDYDGTAADVSHARTQFEIALEIAIEEGFDAVPTIQDEIGTLDSRLTTLGSQPLARAEQALTEAQRTTDPEAALDRWEAVLARYRETLEAGWGTDVQFDGETDALRYQIEWVVARLLTLRTERAESLASDAEDIGSTDPEAARTRLDEALTHFENARQLAAQYRAGDADALAERAESLRSTYQSLG